MKTFKKAFCSSSALVAVALFLGNASPAYANALSLADSGTQSGAAAWWASSGSMDQASVAGAKSGDTVTFTGANTLVIRSNGIASDTSGVLTSFNLGTIDGGGFVSNVLVDAGTGNNSAVIAAIQNTSGAVTVQNTATGAANVQATTGAITAATLTVAGSSVSGNATELTSVGVVNIAGAALIQGGSASGASANFSGSTVQAASFVLDSATGGGTATLIFGLGGAQAITGAINGASAGEGAVIFTDAGVKTLASAGSNIGSSAAVRSVNIALGATLDASTNNNSIATTNGIVIATSSTLKLGSGAVTGAINGDTTQGVGTLEYASDVTVANEVGGAVRLGNINVLSGADVSVGAGHAFNATSIALEGSSTLTIGSGTNLYGTVDGAGSGQGSLIFTGGTHTMGGSYGGSIALTALTVSGGTLQVSHNIRAANVNLSNNSGLAFASNASVQGTLNMSGSSVLNLGGYTVSGLTALNTSGTPSLFLNVGDTAAASGKLELASHLTNTGTLTITPTISGTSVRNGDKVLLADASAGSTLGTYTVSSSGRISWTLQEATIAGTDRVSNAISVGDLVLVADVEAASAMSGVAPANAAAVDALSSVSGGPLSSLATSVQSLTSVSAVNEAGAQLRPDINGAVEQASFGSVNQVLSVIDSRSRAIRVAQARGKKGKASGESTAGLGVWVQGFGSYADQGTRDGIDGYDAGTFGGVFGFDKRLKRNVITGASFSYAYTDVDGKGARSGSNQHVNSYMGTLYGTYSGSPWYVDGNVTFGVHNYDSTRRTTFGGATESATASFSGYQYGVKGEFGYPFNVGGRTILTPFTSLAYNYLDLASYNESGSSSNLFVDGSDASSLRSGLGTKLDTKFASGNWGFKPNVRLAWMHEFNSDAPDMTAHYAGASGVAFTAQGVKEAQDALVLGVGLDVVKGARSSMSVKYDVELKDQYVGQSGMLQFRRTF